MLETWVCIFKLQLSLLLWAEIKTALYHSLSLLPLFTASKGTRRCKWETQSNITDCKERFVGLPGSKATIRQKSTRKYFCNIVDKTMIEGTHANPNNSGLWLFQHNHNSRSFPRKWIYTLLFRKEYPSDERSTRDIAKQYLSHKFGLSGQCSKLEIIVLGQHK